MIMIIKVSVAVVMIKEVVVINVMVVILVVGCVGKWMVQ